MGRRSSDIVGRHDELKVLSKALAAARAGRGGAIFLVGESGIGKSRLAAAAEDLAVAAGMRPLRGRGSTIGPTVPLRSLTEALLSLMRSGEPVDLAALGPYRPVLASLVPDIEPGAVGQIGGSLVILAEAVLRLVGLAGHGRGCLLVLDDLQDADAETLAVVEYLIDNLDRQPALLLGAIRNTPNPALSLAQSICQRGMGTLLELDRLDQTGVRMLAASCLGVQPGDLAESLVDLLWAGSCGNPFLVEEMVSGLVDGGPFVPSGWTPTEQHPPNLAAVLVPGLCRRLELLAPPARQALSAAAILGRQFPLAVVQAVVGLGYQDLLTHLHSNVATQLITSDGQQPGWYAFRHSLITEALRSMLTPAQRASLAHQLADAIEAAYPGLPGEWCLLCAELRLDAGTPVAAGHHFAEAGRRALAQGAASSAVALLDRAWDLLVHDAPGARADVLETQLYALAEAGLVDRALAAWSTLDEVGAGLDRRRKARLRVRLAWVANLAGRTAEGLRQVEAARLLLGPDPAPEDIAPLDAVAAHLEMDLPGWEQLRKAETMARQAALVAEEIPLPVVACQAWQLLGALTRPRDLDEAASYLERSRAIAVQHDLPIWEIHALVRLGAVDALRDGSISRLEQARRQASQIGAVTARYQAEVNIALQLILRGEYAAAERLIDQMLAAVTRLKMLEITQFMLVLRAILAGHRGRRVELERAVAELHRWGGDQVQHLPRVHGLAKAYCALLEEDRELARRELSVALAVEDENPTTFLLSGRYGLNLLLRTMSGETNWSDYEKLTSSPASTPRWDRQFALFAKAVLAGRDGRSNDACAAITEALEVGSPYRMGRHLGLRLVAEAALVDGWGKPVDWLRAAEDHFHRAGIAPVAGACRALLRRSGNPVPPRRNGTDIVPTSLRDIGVTAREYEVLLLLTKRLGNREIADHLHLSQRTVEKHVSNLITKTGLPDRIALSKFASTAERP